MNALLERVAEIRADAIDAAWVEYCRLMHSADAPRSEDELGRDATALAEAVKTIGLTPQQVEEHRSIIAQWRVANAAARDVTKLHEAMKAAREARSDAIAQHANEQRRIDNALREAKYATAAAESAYEQALSAQAEEDRLGSLFSYLLTPGDWTPFTPNGHAALREKLATHEAELAAIPPGDPKPYAIEHAANVLKVQIGQATPDAAAQAEADRRSNSRRLG